MRVRSIMAQEIVAQTQTLAGAFHQTGDISDDEAVVALLTMPRLGCGVVKW